MQQSNEGRYHCSSVSFVNGKITELRRDGVRWTASHCRSSSWHRLPACEIYADSGQFHRLEAYATSRLKAQANSKWRRPVIPRTDEFDVERQKAPDPHPEGVNPERVWYSSIFFLGFLFVLFSLTELQPHQVCADEPTTRYFDELRKRGLFTIAESYAISRLSQPMVSQIRQAELSIELSKTLSAHAETISIDQQSELWNRARFVVEDVLTRTPSHPFELALKCQIAKVLADQAVWLAGEVEVSPYDQSLREKTNQMCQLAIGELKPIVLRLERVTSRRSSEEQRVTVDSFPGSDARRELNTIRYTLAATFLKHGELSTGNSKERRSRISDAEQILRQVIGNADEHLSSRARVSLVTCNRLRGLDERALEMIEALERSDPSPVGEVAEWIVVEKVRILHEQKLDDQGLEAIVKLRMANKRLSGELWYLQLVSLISLRQIAIQKSDEKVAEQIRQQIDVTLERCEEQCGGFWSRRCRSRWESNKSTEKYGPQLELLIQQAKAEFLGGKIEASLERYSQAHLMAASSGQTDLAVEMAYTRASILLNENNFDDAASEFIRISREFPEHDRAPAAHWNGVYSLGRRHELNPNSETFEQYQQELKTHLSRFPKASSFEDVSFRLARLEEASDPLNAITLYQRVTPAHRLADEAHAGIARCFEAHLSRLRDHGEPVTDIEQKAIQSISAFIPENLDGTSNWSLAQFELAERLASIHLDMSNPEYDRAHSLLVAVLAGADLGENKTATDSARWRQIKMRAIASRTCGFVKRGQPRQAERLIDRFLGSSPELLMLTLRKLTLLVRRTENHSKDAAIVALYLVEKLIPFLERFSSEDQSFVSVCKGQLFAANGQWDKAVTFWREQADQFPKDRNRQSEIAVVASSFDNPECQQLAKQCWRRMESLAEPGSNDWLDARLNVIECCRRSNELDEAKKLLGVTKLLYPKASEGDLMTRLTELERRLRVNSPKTSRRK